MKSFKKMLSILFVTIIMIGFSVPALAAEGNVSYLGGSEKFIFAPGSEYSPADLFSNFKDVMPGDSLNQKILVNNDASNDVKVKLYIRALGAQLNTDEFLSQMTLSVKQDGESILFEAPADETAQLSDWVYLGTFYSGGKVTLDVLLNVPLSMDNEFQDAVGYLDWEFKAEEFPVSPVDPKPPVTGDETRLVLWISLMTASAAAVAIMLFGKKRQRKY